MEEKIQLDATAFTTKGRDLLNEIASKVRRTQLFIIRQLPNELLITQEQFKDLMTLTNGTSYMSAVEGIPDDVFKGKRKKAYIFYTPHNAMDVVVVDAPENTLKENRE